MLELSRTGKIVRWQNGGSDRDLLVRPRSRSGLPGGANLCLTHRGVEYLKRDWAPNLQPTHANQNTFTAEVGHETDPNIL